MGEFQPADCSLPVGNIVQIVLNEQAQDPKALVEPVCPELAGRPARKALAGPARRTRWRPLTGIVLVAALVAACGAAPSSHPVASVGHRSGQKSASAGSSPSASPSGSGSGQVKPTPKHGSSSAAATRPVPNVAGDTLARARSVLFTAGFKYYSWLYSCYGSPGILEAVRQDPAAGAQAPLSTRVAVYLQADNCPTPVPNVLGADQSGAVSTLEQAGFRVHWVYECLNSSSIGTVITQSPNAGASYPRGDTVTVDLQANNCPTQVPNVMGMDQSGAVSTLEQAGFQVHWEYECLGSPNTGAVITQSPNAGASYPRGDTVTIDLQANNC
jgi:hypothetical protein